MKPNTKKEALEQYTTQTIEPKWQAKWLKENLYQPNLETAKRPFYNLMMFPYPSAQGMHVGNMYAQTGGDIMGRFKRMQRFDVFEPIGLDGFGIQSENYALKVGSHPVEQAKKSEENFYRQMRATGSGFAWNNSVETWKEDYYKWTQWLFVELFKSGLAYREKLPVNFCPSCKTVLADEQVIDGQCERCGTLVEKRDLEQWLFRITEYAQKLLDGLNSIDWTEKIKIAQRNWIGRSEGAQVSFKIVGTDADLTVFTTRPDTLYGATFMVVSPEHPAVKEWLENPQVKEYVLMSSQKTPDERRDSKEKTGVFSGAYALNPVNNQQLPIWIADYVLMDYGTGAIMAVPAHDERDYDFARKYELPILEVVKGGNLSEGAYTAAGELVNSGDWNGLVVPTSIDKVIASLEEKGIGKGYTNYHLRDWLISRQRYWGPPIPMIFCESCAKNNKSWFTTVKAKEHKTLFSRPETMQTQSAGWYPEETLPVKLPYIEDYKPLGTNASPLANHPDFYTVMCPECGSDAKRETDVSDNFLDSSWYFLRYLATDLSSIPFPMETTIEGETKEDEEKGKKRTQWLPVSIYSGGAEHAVLHLLYTRFLYKVLTDLGYTSGDEPFPKFYAHGLIIKDGAKMSKSKGNVIIPDDYIRKYGADTLRSYLMFLGPFNQGGDFRDSGIEGMNRFLKRVWVLVASQSEFSTKDDSTATTAIHEAIKGVTEDIEEFRYNTSIAKIMTLYNVLSKKESITSGEAKVLLQLLAPFAPHMTEELWERIGEKGSIHKSSWPTFDPQALVKESVTIAVMVNGKLRDTLEVSIDESKTQEKIEAMARASEKVIKHVTGMAIKNVIYVPGKILNFVVA